ncbi:MAG: sterol desaturase family protein [Candidatus Thiodiazotropha sp.]
MHTTGLISCVWHESSLILRRIIPYLVWPGLLGISGLFAALLLNQNLGVGNVLLATLFFSLACMGLLEALMPFRRDWRGIRREWLSNGIYFLLNGLNGNLAKVVAAVIAIGLAPEQTGVPLLIAVPAAVLIGSFTAYWWHRLGHRFALLWRLHGVHHVPEKLFMFNNNTVHFLDLLISGILTTLPLLVLGFSEQAIAIALFLGNFQGFFNHLNVDARMGILGYLFMGPEHHRFHHSQRTEEALNFGSELAIWDQLFGTFLYRPGGQPVRIGISQPNEFPEDVELLQSFLYPFRR